MPPDCSGNETGFRLAFSEYNIWKESEMEKHETVILEQAEQAASA
jgi:hypothetical protein